MTSESPSFLLYDTLPVCAFFASCLQDLIQFLHHHWHVDLCAFSKHLGLFLRKSFSITI